MGTFKETMATKGSVTLYRQEMQEMYLEEKEAQEKKTLQLQGTREAINA